jgi:hypothetical protein
VDTFLRDAERILETAVSGEPGSPDYVICVSRTDAIHILSDVTGWSLPALAAELGAAALYRVERKSLAIRVEGWSYGRKCTISRDLSNQWWSGPARPGYATRNLLVWGGGSSNDLSPQVLNS